MRNKSCSFIVFWKQNKRRTTGGRNITTRWWNIEAQCNECKVSCTLQEALFSADGELTYIFQCPKCKTLVRWTLFASALAHRALMQDFHAKTNAKPCVQAPAQPITPPLALPAPPITLTKQDERQLHSWGIAMPEDGTLQWARMLEGIATRMATWNSFPEDWNDSQTTMCHRATPTPNRATFSEWMTDTIGHTIFCSRRRQPTRTRARFCSPTGGHTPPNNPEVNFFFFLLFSPPRSH